MDNGLYQIKMVFFLFYGYCSDGVVVGNALLDKDLLNHFDFKTLELEEQ